MENEQNQKLVAKFNELQKKIKKIDLENELRQNKLQEYRQDIINLGFNPDNLDTEIESLQTKITQELTRIGSEVEKALADV